VERVSVKLGRGASDALSRLVVEGLFGSKERAALEAARLYLGAVGWLSGRGGGEVTLVVRPPPGLRRRLAELVEGGAFVSEADALRYCVYRLLEDAGRLGARGLAALLEGRPLRLYLFALPGPGGLYCAFAQVFARGFEEALALAGELREGAECYEYRVAEGPAELEAAYYLRGGSWARLGRRAEREG